MFNFEEADRVLVGFHKNEFNSTLNQIILFSKLTKIATLQELIEALRKLKEEVKNQREETTSLKKALQECLACKIKKPQCGDEPPPCFPKYFNVLCKIVASKRDTLQALLTIRVECRDTNDGPVCGPCPPGFKGDGRFCERDACSQNPCYSGVTCYSSTEQPFFRFER
jgi:thrombospondin 2/3/4/5